MLRLGDAAPGRRDGVRRRAARRSRGRRRRRSQARLCHRHLERRHGGLSGRLHARRPHRRDRGRRRRDDAGERRLSAGAADVGARHPRPCRPQPAVRRRTRSARVAVHEVRSVGSAIDFWRRHDGCADTPTSERSGAVARTRYLGCNGGSEVELLTIEGGGHSWPGGERLARFLDPPSSALDATADLALFRAALTVRKAARPRRRIRRRRRRDGSSRGSASARRWRRTAPAAGRGRG